MPETEATKVKIANTANCHICVNSVLNYIQGKGTMYYIYASMHIHLVL